MPAGVLLIACGALARELVELLRRNEWNHIRIKCLPAELHHRPGMIPSAVEETIEKYGSEYQHIFIAYADCGTSGLLDRVLEKHGVERIPGAHCYEFFAGSPVFGDFSDAEPGTFYLTDFLVRHFHQLVVKALGLDRHPQLRDDYFGNYKRVIYLAQTRSDELSEQARAHADFLGLDFEEHYTGLTPVENIMKEHVLQWQS